VSRPPHEDDDPGYLRELVARKRASTAQLLFKCARLVNERALAAVPAGGARPRPAHTQLFPHIALEGTRITELADKLGITKQAVGQLVDDLVAWGLVRRVADPDDARARRVVWTAKGRRGLLEGVAQLKALERELACAIGEARFTALHDALLALHDHLTRP
jgi:DNA-binding MarR family transcriptional regulator